MKTQKPESLVHVIRSEQLGVRKGDFERSTLSCWIFPYVPFAMRIHRLWTAFQYDRGFSAFRLDRSGTKAREDAADAVRQYMESVAAPRYQSVFNPQYAFGAKRVVLDHGYLEITNCENFTLVKCDGFRSPEENGKDVVDSLGKRHNVDIIIMASGFKTQHLLTPISIHGTDGKELIDPWRSPGGAEANMG